MSLLSIFQKKFFSKEDESLIVKAIQEAELGTSGEIRVHLSKKIHQDVLQDAAACFSKLKMDQTARRNGVLIYIVPSAHQFSIIGDVGFHAIAGDEFWQSEKQIIENSFKAGQYAKGVADGIEAVGKILKVHFPREDNDVNELNDEISYGK
ncbi:MAG: TPM domain-containing protein [Bacteroidota bacterium]